jgi:hypothetical protein
MSALILAATISFSRMTGTRHVVNFINYGNYDKKTRLREMNRPELNFNLGFEIL